MSFGLQASGTWECRKGPGFGSRKRLKLAFM